MKKISYPFKRQLIQIAAAISSNPFLQNFGTGRIYKGGFKRICVPGLNCYSCPAAVGACPIGALQTVAGSRQFHMSFYVLGTLILIGTLVGRIVCGFLCLFGFFQDLLYKIPVSKLRVPKKIDRPLRRLKYAILALFVILLPIALTDQFGLSDPFFCKYICPVGTLEAGLPLLIKNESLRQIAGLLLNWKLLIATAVIVTSMSIYRPFCKYICPLGAFYSVFNRISVVKLKVDPSKCTGCHICEKRCTMQVDVLKNMNSTECIRCGKCKSECPSGAIDWHIGMVKKSDGVVRDYRSGSEADLS